MGQSGLTFALVLGLALASGPVFVRPAGAQEAGDATISSQPGFNDREGEARTLFEAGVLAYEGGHFDDAQTYFQRSYELSGRTALLHNVALAAERANHDREALAAYREYLEREPNTPRRARAEVRIQALEELLQREGGGSSSGSSSSAASGGGTDVGPGPWILVGVSAAVAVAGAVLVGLAAADVATVEAAEHASRWSAVEAAYERSEPLSIAGFVALGVGVVGAGVGLGWALAGGGEGADSAQIELQVAPGGLALRGSFQ